MKIIADTRERNTDIIDSLMRAGITVDRASLPVGDYAISDRMCVERKTVGDFESSIVNGRLFEQLSRLKAAYEFPLLILEGDMAEFRLQKQAINGAIASIYVDYGVMVFRSEDEEDTVSIILLLVKHETDKAIRAPSAKGGLRSFSDDQFRERVVANLPGIGLHTAKSLLEHFGSIEEVANAELSELTDVQNIGKKRAESIRRIFKGRYGQEGHELFIP